MNSENFQKELALLQIVATGFISLGAIIISIGITMITLFSGITTSSENLSKLDSFAEGIVLLGVAIILLGVFLSQRRMKKFTLDKTEEPEEKQAQESLQNTLLQLQIEELKLEITKLKNQVETEKLNQLKSQGKTRDSKRK